MRLDCEVVRNTRGAGVVLPDVSMIVPVFNVASYVQACLESILANCADVNFELIIIDDGSTDDSHEVILELLAREGWPPLIYIRQANQGLSAVRNRGAALARGDFIGFLDSDDLIVPGQLSRMLDAVRYAGGDLVLGQTEVFDSETGESRPFYDSSYWTALLNGQPLLITHVTDTPDILSLEPNVNYRLISRRFYQQAALTFPEGLLFEDAAVHYRMLLQARTVVLLGGIYYRYRVNRPGKITEQRSCRRFDVLPVCDLSLDELFMAKTNPLQAAAALRGLFRLAWGCGVMTLAEQRHAFFDRAVGIFSSRVPREWMIDYLKRFRGDPKHAVLGLLMMTGGNNVLTALSFKRLPLIELIRFSLRLMAGLLGKGHDPQSAGASKSIP